MLDYSTYFTSYQIGPDAYASLAAICRPYGSRVLLIGGKTAMEQGLPHLLPALQGSGLVLADSLLYGHDCTYARIDALAALCKEHKAHMVFGMGGGKALDTAKGAAYRAGLPVFTFPTIASTCAATTALSVVYKEDGALDSMFFFQRPAVFCFIHTQVIAQAPAKYLRAGMCDTLGKYFECQMSARGDTLSHSSALGREISNMCYGPVIQYGVQALADCEANRVTPVLQQIVLAVLVSTGLVSLLVDEDYNSAIAHSLFYGLAILPGFEETFLHGDVVSYGVLVQLMIDNQPGEMKKVFDFLTRLGVNTCLADMGLSTARAFLEPVLDETVAGPDMAHLPYPVTKDMVYQGILAVEAYAAERRPHSRKEV